MNNGNNACDPPPLVLIRRRVKSLSPDAFELAPALAGHGVHTDGVSPRIASDNTLSVQTALVRMRRPG